jgi:hypothetical protein
VPPSPVRACVADGDSNRLVYMPVLSGMAIGTTIAAAETKSDSRSQNSGLFPRWRSAHQPEEQNSRQIHYKRMKLKPDEPPGTIDELIAKDIR